MPLKDKEQYNAYMNDYMKRRYYWRRMAAIAKLGGVCEMCGSVDGLEFDHIDPPSKSFTMAKAFAGFSEKRVEAELAKCRLLCGKCHKARHVMAGGSTGKATDS